MEGCTVSKRVKRSTSAAAEIIAGAIRMHRFSFVDEEDLQRGIAIALDGAVKFHREVRLSGRDRIDFLCAYGVGIEVKVQGRASSVLSQLERYASHDQISALVLVTNRAQVAVGLPTAIKGKPLHVVMKQVVA